MYNHFDKGMQPKQSILDHLLTITQKKAEGEKKMTDLQRQLAVMDGVLADQGSPTGTPPEQTSLSPVSVSHTDENAKPLMNGAAVEEAEIELVPTAGSEKMEPVAIEN